MDPGAGLLPPRGKIHVYHHNIQTETAWPIKAKFDMKHLQEVGTMNNVYINNSGHMTKMVAMSIYDKNPSKIFFSGTEGPISTKPGMQHCGLEYYNVYINMTL